MGFPFGKKPPAKKPVAQKADDAKVTKKEVEKLIDKKLDIAIEDKILDSNFLVAVRQSTSDPAGHTLMDNNNQFPLTFGPANQMVQGAPQGGRIGNRVRIKSAKLKFRISTTFQNGTTNPLPQPQIVRTILYYDRKDPNNAAGVPFAPILAGSTETFQSGSSDSQFQGNQHDLTRDFNEDRWSVLWQKDYKVGFDRYPVPALPSESEQYGNNDFMMHRDQVVDYTKYIIKNPRWNDTDLTPSTRGLYFYAYTVNAVANPIASATPPIQCNIYASIQIKYEDA